MFKRPLTWFVICLLCLAGAWYFWKLGDRWAAGKKNAPAPPAAQDPPKKPEAAAATAPTGREVVRAESTAPLAALAPPPPRVAPKPDPRAYRLSNTTNTAGQLLRNDHALLLENALLDTALPVALAI